jgi:hypothetical protein
LSLAEILRNPIFDPSNARVSSAKYVTVKVSRCLGGTARWPRSESSSIVFVQEMGLQADDDAFKCSVEHRYQSWAISPAVARLEVTVEHSAIRPGNDTRDLLIGSAPN